MVVVRSVETFIKLLQDQHEMDLQIYRTAHTNMWNRTLHWMMIPLETFAFLATVAVLLSRIKPLSSKSNELAMQAFGWTLGIVSLLISGKSILIGLASFLFHTVAASFASRLVQILDPMSTLAVAFFTWTVAWILQVGVGHWILEGNQPNLANTNEVSWLAMTQSVLIAWKS